MIKNLVTLCVKRSGSVVIVGLIVFGLGIYLLETARLDVFPEFAPPQVVIQTEAPGFSSETSEITCYQTNRKIFSWLTWNRENTISIISRPFSNHCDF